MGTHSDAGDGMPADVTRPVDRVIVVGAGIAGLTVANALAHAGIECVVLEARDRIGGRLHTIDVAGSPVDMGGSWISHPVGNPLRDVAHRFGIACRGADPLPELAGYDLGEQRRLSRPDVEAELRLLYEKFPAAVERMQETCGPDASIADAIDAFVAESGLEASAARRARQGLNAVVEAESADLAARQSLRWMWNEMEYGGSLFGDVLAGGYRELVHALAEGLDVRLGVDVVDVAASAGGVAVTAADGSVEAATHVVVTVPLGVLKSGRPRFDPPLPPDRAAAIDRLGFGRLEKVVLAFEEPFWRTAGLPHVMVFPRNHNEVTTWLFGHDAFGVGAVIVAHAFHSSTGHVLDVPADEAAGWVLDMLSEAIGAPCPVPLAVAVTSWANDPYSRGAYSHIPPGAQPADADLLGEPIGGRLLFAGEHTQSERLVYVDGAMASGLREAERLLGQSKVVFGPMLTSE
jgi:polyamine oxidase